MAILGIVSQTAWKVANKVGLYSKKQSVELATSIGKELVDISRGGGEITKDIVQATLKKHVPRVNVSIITDKEELISEFSRICREPEKIINDRVKACYNNIMGHCSIYIPKISSSQDISILAHEIEHLIYNNHTMKRKTYITYECNKEKIKEYFGLFRKWSGNSSKRSLQFMIHDYFGLKDLGKNGELQGVAANSEAINQFLRDKMYKSDNIIIQDLKNIIQCIINPKRPKFLKINLYAKTSIDDEIRAYSVSDNVYRYATNSQNATRDGAVVEAYKKVSEILNNNINFALNPLNWFKK